MRALCACVFFVGAGALPSGDADRNNQPLRPEWPHVNVPRKPAHMVAYPSTDAEYREVDDAFARHLAQPGLDIDNGGVVDASGVPQGHTRYPWLFDTPLAHGLGIGKMPYPAPVAVHVPSMVVGRMQGLLDKGVQKKDEVVYNPHFDSVEATKHTFEDTQGPRNDEEGVGMEIHNGHEEMYHNLPEYKQAYLDKMLDAAGVFGTGTPRAAWADQAFVDANPESYEHAPPPHVTLRPLVVSNPKRWPENQYLDNPKGEGSLNIPWNEDTDDPWEYAHLKYHNVWDANALGGVGDWKQRWGDDPNEPQEEHDPPVPRLFSDNEDGW
jgi:hypothetical protein